MVKRSYLLAAGLTLILVGGAGAQHPILDMLAGKVVEKYQSTPCEQLLAQRGQPKSAREEEMVKLLKADPSAPRRVPQQDRRSGRQQDVRMRDDSVAQRGCMRMAPSSRIVSPFSIEFSMM